MKVLVLGGTGMLGHKLFQVLGERYATTYCTIRGTKVGAGHGLSSMFQTPMVYDGVDAQAWDSVARVLNTVRPDVIVNCIGVIKQRRSAEDPISSITLNALLPHRAAAEASHWGGRFIHISTDCVFSGRRGNYTEADHSDAEDLYGRTKYLGEVSGDNAITLRTSIIGREIHHKSSLLEWFLAQDGKPIKGYTRAMYSGLTTIELSRVIGQVIEDYPNMNGLWHVAGPVISKFELLMLLRDAYGLDVDIEPYDEFHCDRSLDAARFKEATGYQSPQWEDMVNELVNDPTRYE